MIFITWFYPLFVAVLFLVYWFCTPSRFRPWIFAAGGAGLFLYAFPAQTLLVFVLAVLVFLTGEYLGRERLRYRKAMLILGVLTVLAILGYFKYGRLFVETVNCLFHTGMVLPGMAVSLGISFYTFRFISYLIDVKREVIKRRSFRRFLLYAFFFPILPSGPIERFAAIDGQSREMSGFRREYIEEGAPRIIWGLFKKLVLADSISFLSGYLADPRAGAFTYWLGMYAATLKIYWDFSGYTDIAIGTSRLFGYKIIENFDNPYLKTNVSLFWKSWHISLTRWFRDYLFIPLGGSRRGFGVTVRNTIIVWAATGIWHGAAWHFLFWGLYHAVGLIVLRLYNLCIARRLPAGFKQSRVTCAFSIFITFHFVAVGWIFFFVNVRQALHVIKVMAGL